MCEQHTNTRKPIVASVKVLGPVDYSSEKLPMPKKQKGQMKILQEYWSPKPKKGQDAVPGRHYEQLIVKATLYSAASRPETRYFRSDEIP